MKRTPICVTAAALLAVAAAPAVIADSVKARCDVYPKGEDRASASVPCTFSQMQGNVYIDRSDGVSYALSTTNKGAGNYLDQSGRPAYRQSGLGDGGLIFRLATESVYVYWDASPSGPAAKQADNPTAPYTTADYDATTLLPCSIGEASHDRSCPAGIRRGKAGSGNASIWVEAPDGSERELRFEHGDVTTPGEGKLTWGKQSDEWYIGIDGREFYIVPDAALTGG